MLAVDTWPTAEWWLVGVGGLAALAAIMSAVVAVCKASSAARSAGQSLEWQEAAVAAAHDSNRLQADLVREVAKIVQYRLPIRKLTVLPSYDVETRPWGCSGSTYRLPICFVAKLRNSGTVAVDLASWKVVSVRDHDNNELPPETVQLDAAGPNVRLKPEDETDETKLRLDLRTEIDPRQIRAITFAVQCTPPLDTEGEWLEIKRRFKPR